MCFAVMEKIKVHRRIDVKKAYVAVLMALIFSLTACGSSETTESGTDKISEEQVVTAQEVKADPEEKVADPGYVFCT